MTTCGVMLIMHCIILASILGFFEHEALYILQHNSLLTLLRRQYKQMTGGWNIWPEIRLTGKIMGAVLASNIATLHKRL